MRKRFGQLFVVNKDCEAAFFDRRWRHQGQLAIADKNRGGNAAFDRRAEIKFSAAQGKHRRVALDHQIGHGGEWPAEILRVLSDLPQLLIDGIRVGFCVRGHVD